MDRVRLRLSGPVCLTRPDDTDVTPRGMKARGLLAVLGVARCNKVTRARLQDLLYSDRGSEQGAASIRQLLREIRIALGASRDVLTTGPGWIGLNKRMIEIDDQPRLGGDGLRQEFASDLDIADPEFESWLRDVRMQHETKPTAPVMAQRESDTLRLFVQMPMASDPKSSVLAAMILNDAASRTADLYPIELIHGEPSTASTHEGIELGVLASQLDNTTQLLFSARHYQTGRVLWTRRFGLPEGDMDRAIGIVSGNLTIAILHGLQNIEKDSSPQALRMPIEDVFSYTKSRLGRALNRLRSIEDGESSPIVLSLQSYIRNTMVLERLSPNPQEDALIADDLARRALEKAPGNATVLAVNAVISTYKNDTHAAYEMARHAITADPDNPMAVLAMSSSLSGIGKHKEAIGYASSVSTEGLTALGPAAWELRLAIASLSMDDQQAAERHFATAHAFAPENRPALRFLAGIRYELSDFDGARDALNKLKQLEPDFTLEMMGSDGYPVDTLRQKRMMNVTKSGLI